MNEKDSYTDYEFEFDYEEDGYERERRSKRRPGLAFILLLLAALLFA